MRSKFEFDGTFSNIMIMRQWQDAFEKWTLPYIWRQITKVKNTLMSHLWTYMVHGWSACSLKKKYLAAPAPKLASEASLPHRSSKLNHPYSQPHPRSIMQHGLATRCLWGDVRSLVDYHPEKILHSCWMTGGVQWHLFRIPPTMSPTDHDLLSWSQSEWTFPPQGEPLLYPSMNPRVESLALKALIRCAPGKEGSRSRSFQTEVTASAGHDRPQKLRQFLLSSDGWHLG